MDRRRTSLLLPVVFIGCSGAAIVIGGSRPAGVLAVETARSRRPR